MADKKKADKKADAPAKNSGGGLMGLIGKIMGALSLIAVTVLIAGIYDIGHFGLREMVFSLAWAPLALFVTGGLAHIFLGGAKAPDIPADTEALNAKIDDVQQKTASRFSSIQNSLDLIMGKDYEALAEENKQLKEQLEAITRPSATRSRKRWTSCASAMSNWKSRSRNGRSRPSARPSARRPPDASHPVIGLTRAGPNERGGFNAGPRHEDRPHLRHPHQ